jgi:hypothetical protein
MQTPDDLSEAAKIAYQAFVDMKQGKTAYFASLEAIENKYSSGGAPSLAENLELEKLLSIHDKNVLAFKSAMADVTDEAEKAALVQLLS